MPSMRRSGADQPLRFSMGLPAVEVQHVSSNTKTLLAQPLPDGGNRSPTVTKLPPGTWPAWKKALHNQVEVRHVFAAATPLACPLPCLRLAFVTMNLKNKGNGTWVGNRALASKDQHATRTRQLALWVAVYLSWTASLAIIFAAFSFAQES